jgi:hypothetical protein
VGGSDPDGRQGGGAPGGATGDLAADRVTAAVEELYAADPAAFTGRRTELAAAARDAGDRAAAKAITALRRPTRAAWVVNRLARTDPSAPPKLAELAAALRAAQQARHGPRLRELSAARGALVDALTAQALGAADLPDPPAALRLEVAETLTAAVADPEVAADFAAGTLTRAVQWSGFGVPLEGSTPGSETDVKTRAVELPETGSSGSPGTDSSGSRAAAGARPGRESVARVPTRAVPADGTPTGTARRQAEAQEERLAREAPERAARRREQREEAEQMVVAAATAAAEADAAEDRLEAEVRDLEQRLTQARSDLAAARMRARHAEAAERRARQALDRLPRE